MALLFSDDYGTFPTEPTLRWLKLHDLVEKRLSSNQDYMNGVSLSDMRDYCATLSAAAEELGVGKLEPLSQSNPQEDYERFRSDVIALATRLNLRASGADISRSVALSRSAKTKIYLQIEKLRKLIEEANLPPEQTEKLNHKLDELRSLVQANRTEFGSVMKILAIIGASLVGTTSFLADAPAAMATITALIGEEKEAEEEEMLQLAAEQKPLQLPKPEADDDIPF
ncbi:hypothetical protein FBT96_09620 [Rhodobacter capsulatus]|uniref:Uncharacterized protein n=1 Tax=Rhodobacter capsulatus TaxID=1061 RepID=A0A4U1JQQ9_RHOCA|nr:hypothetical protein FBT96_09620 [Rhodobacter capsulatus]